MIKDKDELISVLKANIQRLKVLYEKEKETCSEIKNQNMELTAKFAQKEAELQSLEVKYNTLKLAGSLGGDRIDKTEAKNKVTNLVREIDKCIALLNR
jgi:phosphopantetheinyl transferase (holo-ACP synthase)